MRELTGREINEASGVGAFLRRWYGTDPALTVAASEPRRSRTGNINLAATEGSSQSAMLAAGDVRFDDFLEPGVAPLVRAAIALGWITYTSCEGHRYDDGSVDEMHIGIIARNDRERAGVERAWRAAGAFWVKTHPASAVELALSTGTLHCDGRIDLPTLDLYLCRDPDRSWDDYFAARTEAAAAVADFLRKGGA
jgi:hypothetical protein